MNEQNFKIGDKVYTADDYNGFVVSGTITEFLSSGIVGVHFDPPLYGTAGRYIKDLYKSKEECEQAIKAANEERVKAYYDEIKTVNDLINFALENCIGPAEEYTDYAAREAYIKRAKELGMIIDD